MTEPGGEAGESAVVGIPTAHRTPAARTGTEGAVAGVARLSRRQNEAAMKGRPADPGPRK
jgi:hypothetical protein